MVFEAEVVNVLATACDARKPKEELLDWHRKSMVTSWTVMVKFGIEDTLSSFMMEAHDHITCFRLHRRHPPFKSAFSPPETACAIISSHPLQSVYLKKTS